MLANLQVSVGSQISVNRIEFPNATEITVATVGETFDVYVKAYLNEVTRALTKDDLFEVQIGITSCIFNVVSV